MLGLNTTSSDEPAGRRLLCFFDGTSNRAVGPKNVSPTNVFRLNQAFTYGFHGVPQITFYFSGVGTRGDTLSMATGKGFDQIIMEAYINIASNYKDGDKIYLFGFSRGAAAARALSGLLAEPGLLGADSLAGFPNLWEYFVNASIGAAERRVLLDSLKDSLTKPAPVVEFVGAFDTVPGTSWDFASLFTKVRFHNLVLPAIVKNAVQVLALDDNRKPSFTPLLWSKMSNPDDQFLQQIWMPGVHGDIGGASDGTLLSDVALLTMIERIGDRCPELEWDTFYIGDVVSKVRQATECQITSEREGLVRKFLFHGEREVGSKESACQLVHPIFSMMKDRSLKVRGRKQVYAPRNMPDQMQTATLMPAHLKLIEGVCHSLLD